MKEKIISPWTILSFPVSRASQSVCSEDTKHWNLPPVILSDTTFMLTLEDGMDLWICQIFPSRSSGAGLNQFYEGHSDDDTPFFLSLSCQSFTSLMLIFGHFKEFIQVLPSARVYIALIPNGKMASIQTSQCIYMHISVRLQPEFNYAAQSDNCNCPSIHAGEKIAVLSGACQTRYARWCCTHFN